MVSSQRFDIVSLGVAQVRCVGALIVGGGWVENGGRSAGAAGRGRWLGRAGEMEDTDGGKEDDQ